MEPRTLDIAAGIITLILFIILLLIFQLFIPPMYTGFGYITALVLFLIIMSVAGYFINEKIT